MEQSKFSKALVKFTCGLFIEATSDASLFLMALRKVGFVLGQILLETKVDD
jgi:hypothetical protein